VGSKLELVGRGWCCWRSSTQKRGGPGHSVRQKGVPGSVVWKTWSFPDAEDRGNTRIRTVKHLTPFFARFPFEDLSHLFFELIKVGKLGKVLLLDAKLVQEGGVELRLDAPNGHEVVVQGAVSLVEVDARVE